MTSFGAPVVLLSYHYSGAQYLQDALRDRVDLAYTAGTGILPLCNAAAQTWRRIDGNSNGKLPGLALASIRSFAGVLITAIQADSGTRRWCEIATARADAAEIFLQLFPATRFVCVHRRCLGVVAASINAHPWAIGNGEFDSFPAAYPGNNAAAVAAYWASHTEQLLAFEQARGEACLRVRYEDLVADQSATLDEVSRFIGIEGPALDLAPWPSSAPPDDAKGSAVPHDAIPAGLRERIDLLNEQLAYPRRYGS